MPAPTRALVVDDDPTVRGIVIAALKAHGFLVDEAQDGLTALAVIEQRSAQFDIVITDIEMPKMNGRDLGQHLRAAYPRTAGCVYVGLLHRLR